MQDKYLLRTPEIALIVTGANWTTANATGYFLKTLDGAWRFVFNILGTWSVSSASPGPLTVQGISITTRQALSGEDSNNTNFTKAFADSSGLFLRFGASTTQASFAGNIKLSGKPSIITE